MNYGVNGTPAQILQRIHEDTQRGALPQGFARAVAATMKALHDLELPPYGMETRVQIDGYIDTHRSSYFRASLDCTVQEPDAR